MRLLQKSAKNSLKKQRLYVLLFTSTLWLVLSTSAVPSYSQTPTPTPRPKIEQNVCELAKSDVENLWWVFSNSPLSGYSQTPTFTPRLIIEQNVCELAKSDVENDIPRRNDYAVKRYGKKSLNLKDDEILQIYDDEYTKQNDIKKSSFWKQLPQKNEWFAVITLFLVFTFNDVLKEWITKIIKSIALFFYNLSSRSEVFNKIPLRKYRNGLIEKYQQSSIPYLPQRRLDLHEVYVPLEVISAPENRTYAVNALKQHTRLIFKGEPGSGKSMLLKYIVFSYAKGWFKNNENWNTVFSDRPIPVLLELRRLNDSEKTLQQHFVDALDRDGFSNGERFVKHNLQQGKLMLLLDGLDEVNSNILWRVIRDIKDLLDTNSQCPVIITCRTAVYKDEFSWELKSAGSRSFETLAIADFNENQIHSFLNVWERDMPPGKSILQLTNILQRETRTYELAQRPLILAIIAYLYTYNDLKLFDYSSTKFYQNATDILLNQRYSEANQFSLEDKKRILRQLALYYQKQQQYRLASEKVSKFVRDIIKKLDIDVESNQAKLLLEEIINRSGLMMATDNGTVYQFVHRSFQEFFVAEALQEEENKNNQAGFLPFYQKQKEEKVTGKGKELITKFNNDQKNWQEIVRFWCGLAKNPTYVIGNVYEKNQILALELLTEIKSFDAGKDSIVTQIINEFQRYIFKKDINTDEIDKISRAFSSLAVNNAFSTESKGNEIFDFFKKEVVENKITDILYYKKAVNILSMTYTAEAVNILISQYTQREQSEELRQILDQALIRIGDIAVPEIEKAINDDSINQVMDALVGIGTPSALQALVYWLWDKDENRALRAALLLASLIKEEKHKTMLNACKLPQIYSRQDSFDWIVNPYRAEQVLHTILLQIVYCINKKLKNPVEVIDQFYIRDFDQKLIVPICFIQAFENGEFNASLKKLENSDYTHVNYENNIQKLCGHNQPSIWVFLIYNIYPLFIIKKSLICAAHKTIDSQKREWQSEYFTLVKCLIEFFEGYFLINEYDNDKDKISIIKDYIRKKIKFDNNDNNIVVDNTQFRIDGFRLQQDDSINFYLKIFNNYNLDFSESLNMQYYYRLRYDYKNYENVVEKFLYIEKIQKWKNMWINIYDIIAPIVICLYIIYNVISYFFIILVLLFGSFFHHWWVKILFLVFGGLVVKYTFGVPGIFLLYIFIFNSLLLFVVIKYLSSYINNYINNNIDYLIDLDEIQKYPLIGEGKIIINKKLERPHKI